MHLHLCLLLLGAVALPACGGVVIGDGEGVLRVTDAGNAGADPTRSDAGPTGSGGRGNLAPPGRMEAGKPEASSPDPLPDCPIRKSGTELTEADCHRCFLPGRDCEGGLPDRPMTTELMEEVCVDLATSLGTLWCFWYAEGDPFDQPWGAVISCPSNAGRVYCGGGI